MVSQLELESIGFHFFANIRYSETGGKSFINMTRTKAMKAKTFLVLEWHGVDIKLPEEDRSLIIIYKFVKGKGKTELFRNKIETIEELKKIIVECQKM